MQYEMSFCLQLMYYSSVRSPAPLRLVLFDTALQSLALPIFRPVGVADIRKLPAQHKAQVVDVLQRYIGWVGTIEKGAQYRVYI